MFPNASGDAPSWEDTKQHNSNRSDSTYVWQTTHEKWKSFNDVRTEGLFFDVVLKSNDGKSFPAHRIILCACSPYFKSLFSGRWESGNRREISIPGVSACVMEHILQFVYNREIILTSLKETKELVIAANHLGIEEIVQECYFFLHRQMDIDNCLDIWDFARTYYCHDMEASAKSYILKHIIKIACVKPSGEHQSIWNLSATDLQFFLGEAELNVSDESLTFWIILRWIQRDIMKRRKYIYQLLLTVRWISLTKEFIENVVLKNIFIQHCKDARRFVEYVKEQIDNGNFCSDRPPPCSTKRDLNGNFLISSSSYRSELVQAWSTPRLPRSLILVVGGWCEDSPSNTAEIYEPRSKIWNPANRTLPPILQNGDLFLYQLTIGLNNLSSPFDVYAQRPRAYHSVLYHDGFMYVIGGYDGYNTYNSCDRYDVMNCQWQEMCGMHNKRCYVGVAYLDGCIYAFGGSDGSDAARLKSAEKFHPKTNVWKQLPDMFERRSDAGGCSLGRRVYVAGGFTGEECVLSVECFDSQFNQWHRLTRMAMARSGVSVVAYQGRVVVLGGYDGRNRLKSVESYNPDTNQWSMMKPMLTKRSNFTACVIEGKLVVIGGFNGNSTCSNVEYYDEGYEDVGIELCRKIQSEIQKIEIGRTSDGANTSNLSEDFMDEDNVGCISSSLSASMQSHNIPQVLMCKNGFRPDSPKWRPLPNMKMSRSALSCCVLNGLPPSYLNSLLRNEI